MKSSNKYSKFTVPLSRNQSLQVNIDKIVENFNRHPDDPQQGLEIETDSILVPKNKIRYSELKCMLKIIVAMLIW